LNYPELVVQLQQGDEQAFKKLVEEWQDMVYNTAVSIVKNEDDADDITQDVFIQVHQSVNSFKGDAKFSTWLYRIAISKALDHLKKKKRKKRFALIQNLLGNTGEEALYPKEFNHPGIVIENKERAAELFKALEQISDKQRIAFTLHKLEGQKHQDIAEIMHLSLVAVESLIARAKVSLRKILKQYYEENNF
jgi:RNA polymerase sigma factor (sigma-70 family)